MVFILGQRVARDNKQNLPRRRCTAWGKYLAGLWPKNTFAVVSSLPEEAGGGSGGMRCAEVGGYVLIVSV